MHASRRPVTETVDETEALRTRVLEEAPSAAKKPSNVSWRWQTGDAAASCVEPPCWDASHELLA
jgi:hypothetical protein